MNATEKRVFKDGLYEQVARMGKALASGRRLELLDLLAQGERTVEDLAQQASLSIANTSQHLQGLRRAHLVEVRRKGNYIYYRLADDTVLSTWLSLRDLAAARLPEIERVVTSLLKGREALEPITADQLKRRLKSVVVLDVRPRTEFESGHLPTARSIPITELKRRLKELPRHREIVAYCRGPYCVLADQAVRLLRARGYKALRLVEGLPEWKIKGFPIEFPATSTARSGGAWL
jgi:DNA-binding transcriptional ArsR family regulator